MLEEDWHKVCHIDDLGDEEVMQFWVGDTPLAIYRLEDAYYASTDICPHQGGSLSEGYIEDGQIECPLHQGCYDVTTGEARSGPACGDLATYSVTTQDAWVYVQFVEDF